MERINLEAQLREEKGKQLMKRLRTVGFIPAIVYKGGKDNLNLKVSDRDFGKVIGTKAGSNVIINLKIAAKKEKTVMIKEIQRHPVNGGILHIDFNEISLTDTIKVQVRVEPKGEAAGVKEGGTLERIIREVEIECLPTQIPAMLEVDVTNMKIGDTLYVKDITAPEGVKIHQDPSLILMSLKPPFVEKVAEAVPAEGAAAEPELIRKKKEAEEEGEEGEAKEAKDEKKEAPSKEEKK